MVLKTLHNMISGAYRGVSDDNRPKVTAGLMAATALSGYLAISAVEDTLSGVFTFVSGKDEYSCVINSNDFFRRDGDTIKFVSSSKTMKATGLDCAPN